MMFILTTALVILVQAVLSEFAGESGLLYRLWILPIVAMAFDTKRVRLLPIVLIGLLVDGLYAAPTGFHVLELGLLYASLSLFIEHLGHRTIASRVLLGLIVGLLNLIIHFVLAHGFGATPQANYLLDHTLELLLTQSGIIAICLPLFYKLLVSVGSGEQRLNVDRGNP